VLNQSLCVISLRHRIAAGSFAAVITIAATVNTLAADPDPRFPHPDRIRYDSQCLTIDGHDMQIYSGAFHYFRCPKELWRDRFQKIKDAGFNTVETYVAWNDHEREMPSALDDFSKVDLRDMEDWLKLAEEFGCYIIIRPGPYICAEWDRGGFPGWLINKRPEHLKEKDWFRSDDPQFIAWSKHWYDAVCPAIAKHQVTHKKPGEPGIILFQLENEYDYARNFSETVKSAYVRALADAALAKGIDVPLFTCWTKCIRGTSDPVLKNVFDSCNFYPGWNVEPRVSNDIAKLRSEQPNAPLMTTELQGGWFTQVGEEPPIRPDSDHYRNDLVGPQINNLTLLALQNGETITNYYMLFGGTNLADTAGHKIATCYDYSSPIRENGGVSDKYLRVKALGQFIHDHGEKLARAKAVDGENTVLIQNPDDGELTRAKDVTVAERRASDGSRYLFVHTNQHTQPRKGTVQVKEKDSGNAEFKFDYELEPFGSKVLYLPPGETDASNGQWLPKQPPAIDRPSDLPGAVKIGEVESKKNPDPTTWKTLKPGQDLNDAGVYDNRFACYQTSVKLSAEDIKAPSGLHLRVDCPQGDYVVPLVNGQIVAPRSGTAATVFRSDSAFRAGENNIALLYENTGTVNIGPEMEKRAGIKGVRIISADQDQQPIGNWRMKVIDSFRNPERRSEIGSQFDDSEWTEIELDKVEAAQLKPNETAVFRATVDLTEGALKNGHPSISIRRMDDEGWVFVNGKKIGEGHDWADSYKLDAGKEWRAGRNTIAVIVHNKDGGGGLGLVEMETSAAPSLGTASPLKYSDQPFVGSWNATKANGAGEGSWTRRPLPETSSDQPELLSWHRLTFELPEGKSGMWVPWLIRIHANGNGFIDLNGHAIGRYWQGGKQSDYYLPECWLNPAGQKNTVTLQLRPLEKAAAIESAEVMPYIVYAERR
jgi:Glycosyl hydrolases family 35